MHGRFLRADGLVLPNNITRAGASFLLDRALRPDVVTQSLYIGLCKGSPTPTLTRSEIEEPSDGVNGYLRQLIANNSAAWPDTGAIGGQQFAQTKWFTFAATGPGFDKPIQRLFLTPAPPSGAAGNEAVFAISAALPSPVSILADTPSAQRTFRYQLFLGA